MVHKLAEIFIIDESVGHRRLFSTSDGEKFCHLTVSADLRQHVTTIPLDKAKVDPHNNLNCNDRYRTKVFATNDFSLADTER